MEYDLLDPLGGDWLSLDRGLRHPAILEAAWVRRCLQPASDLSKSPPLWELRFSPCEPGGRRWMVTF